MHKKLNQHQELELKVKLLIALSHQGWTHVSGLSLSATTAVAVKTFPVINYTADAILYLTYYDNGQYKLSGEFTSRGENVMTNINYYFNSDASQEELNSTLGEYIKKVEDAILNSFGCRMAVKN